ncbi:PI-PLC X domain-containing protein 3 [Amyelois transitella]|uniref:PI-PLC X domain-containing protein 3 n=1 Tax=Amyelois transitella TaxID=680683 RepID=UPI00299052B9|nr:PI-PLC X domain-containing protein 3 [Amyelois transitella]XP_013200997.2 PI-PLC X domain-containing protein 3 [Amyelois transitella]
MGEESAAQINLESWMTDLPAQLKEVPLIYLAIPGSHDSMTYGITRASGLAPDAEPILHQLYPLFRGTILRWTITQAIDVHQQLLIGIRYFDLRLATKNGTDSFFFTHGVYADEITGPLEKVREFIDSHPEEVVILDCQHFYGFDIEDHRRLMLVLIKMFGNRLVPRQIDLQAITLNSLHRLRQQVVVVYRHQSVYSMSEFWQPQMMPSPWPQQDRTSGLISFLENVKRHPGMGFVHQAVLTPTPAFIVLRWLSNLRKKCAVPVKEQVLPKLLEMSPGPPLARGVTDRAPLNVVIADFVDLDDALFPRKIIELNWKLLRNTDFVYHNYG